MTDLPNNEKSQTSADKKQQLDKINHMIKDLQQSVEELQNEIDSEKKDSNIDFPDKEKAVADAKKVIDSVSENDASNKADDKAQKSAKSSDDVSNKGDIKNADTDSAEYVTPIYYTKRHKKRSRKQDKKEDNQRIIPDKMPSDTGSVDDYVFMKPIKKKKKKTKKQRFLQISGIVFAVIIGIFLVTASTIFILNQVGKNEMHDYDDIDIKPSPDIADVTVENSGRVIKYKNHTYGFNEDVITCVLLGVDKDNLIDKNESGTAGQCDAIYIAAINTETGKVSIIGVSRDTIIDVNTYDSGGSFIDTTPMQICLSYGYGDGKHKSCENTLTSLERLFYGMPFETYFSMDFDALKTLNDQIGGVTLTPTISLEAVGECRAFTAGQQMTLSGAEALRYIRNRDMDELGSNSDRMSRQKQYMTAYLAQVLPAVKKDLSVITDLYSCVSENSTTNLSPSKITYLASVALSGVSSDGDVEFLNIPGEVRKGKYAEFYADEDALMQLMLDVFYVKVN